MRINEGAPVRGRMACRVLVLAGALFACSPTFNWREVAPEGVALKGQLPCKPDKAERVVPLTAAGTTLSLWSCEAGGLTFALAWAQAGSSEPPQAVLERWRQAGWASLGVAVPPVGQLPEGWKAIAQPVPQASLVQAWQGPGQDHQGRRIEARQLYFSQGGMVYQAAVYGPRWSPEAQAFFDALSLRGQP